MKKDILPILIAALLLIGVIALHFIPVDSYGGDYYTDCSGQPSSKDFRTVLGQKAAYDKAVMKHVNEPAKICSSSNGSCATCEIAPNPVKSFEYRLFIF